MKIAVLGCGAMGMLIGGYLSRENQVYLIDIDKNKVDAVNQSGVTIQEKDGVTQVFPKASLSGKEVGEVDLVILFVKSLFSKAALENNKELIGENTYVMTLQNGAGHEDVLSQFVSNDKIIIGATNHNSSIRETNVVFHGGSGVTYIGLPYGDSSILSSIADSFTKSGVECEVDENIRKIIWSKLFVNSTLSVLTGALQVPMGYMETNPYAKEMLQSLITEAVSVANAEGMGFDETEIQKKVRDVVLGGMEGLTSIYADIRDGRKTEVDTISGAVVKAAKKINVAVPKMEFVVNIIHGLEGKV